MFFTLWSIHIQFKTLQEFQIILPVRIRTKLAIVKQPSVDGVVIPLCVCRLLIRLPRTINRPSSQSSYNSFVNQN